MIYACLTQNSAGPTRIVYSLNYRRSAVSSLQSALMLQAFQKLLQSGRLNPQDVDVEPYVVDNVSYLAKLDTPPL